VTLPDRQGVQLTIYNSAHMTLVRDTRTLTPQKGLNKLQFSWANTLIDPTSLEMVAKGGGKGKVEISALNYPPRTKNVGVWEIQSSVNGEVPVEITYLTSGIGWRAFYMGTLSPDEKEMNLEGYVRVDNRSGEEYAEAVTRLIVGQVHILDQIAALAARQYPYGSPGNIPMPMPAAAMDMEVMEKRAEGKALMRMDRVQSEADAPKSIIKEGLSEYFLYTIEGTETIPDQWGKRLPSFEAGSIPVKNLYKYEEERYGRNVVRFLSFKNDEQHKLGQTPIPGGDLKVYRNVDKAGMLSYEGASSFKYIPVGEDVENNLGAVQNVVVEPKIMNVESRNFMFSQHGDITGWDDVQEFRIEVKNTRAVAVKVEITRNTQNNRGWDVANQPSKDSSGLAGKGDCGTFEKVDMDTFKYTLELKPGERRNVSYVITQKFGTRM